ncbi:MAG: hypothetical protein KDA58_00075 [Planctomycetaceae bacterium]|nr:hypothetical protein [Planctomycetaceae bacterium]
MSRLSRLSVVTLSGLTLCLSVTLSPSTALADPPAQEKEGKAEAPRKGPPFGRGFGRQNDPKFQEDHEVFFYLLEHRKSITRTVKLLDNGIETVTESKDPEVAAKIQEHVAAMYDRVENNKPIHMRDPLFRELFRNTKKLTMKAEETEHGVKVTETSDDPYVAKLIQYHAEVVSLFIKNGFSEMPKNHDLPPKDGDEAKPKEGAEAQPKDSVEGR